ncbi:hypothetical protein DAEQUDRAFT_31522 [Daedalea quercina L-15889]|uniref:BTB domain-containing protein n=1 Tax=Daedalea quercina L-15889 TaxID=1314783 RepID=A0A165SQE4_9APHY|nr:hypothetical protein DAEQUDRAFT_31522 [Daedalea quercina L-15889]
MDVPLQNEVLTNFARDEEIWFADGNVVLVTQRRAFKVYQGLLAHASEVFRDLFTIPQPASAETFDGCPVVRLSDHPEDLRHLLRVVFYGQRYYSSEVRLEFAVVAALVRLSHKYQLDYLRDAYLARVKTCFSTDFDTWRTTSRDHGSPVMKLRNEDAVTVVNIARLTRIDSMLPSALYRCIQMDPKRLLRLSLDGISEHLSLEDILKCIRGGQLLLQKIVASNMDIFNLLDSALQCGIIKCRNNLEKIRQQRLD